NARTHKASIPLVAFTTVRAAALSAHADERCFMACAPMGRADAVTLRIVGVDGCRGGWIVAERDAVTVIDRLEPLVADAAISAIGVDMPIGLPDVWGRSADVAARRFLGRRASTVFPTPPRPLISSTTYEEANARRRETYGRGLSRQTFNLFPKI